MDRLSDVQAHLKEKKDLIEYLKNILITIVIYKIDIVDCQTFKSLKELLSKLPARGYIDLLICDNSPTAQTNINNIGSNLENLNLYYLHDHSNPGISISYNKSAEFARTKEKKWILVFDQDTHLSENTIDKYIDALIVWPDYPIYTPRIYVDGELFSPCRYILFKGSPLTHISEGVHLMKWRNVLNSGLLIDLDAYSKAGGYDEIVWLYFSDFVFFDRLKKCFDKFVVIDCCLEHQLSSTDYTNYQFAYDRFNYYCRGAREASASKKSLVVYCLYCLTVGLRSVIMSYRFKKMSFMKNFIHIFFRNRYEY